MHRNLNVETTWPAVPARPRRRLALTWGAHQIEVTIRHPSLTVGRGGMNGIVIKNEKVSRQHARIDYGESGFLLTDLSSNGTFVTDSGGNTRLVRNETHSLTGRGTISFGVDPANGPTHLVRYDAGS